MSKLWIEHKKDLFKNTRTKRQRTITSKMTIIIFTISYIELEQLQCIFGFVCSSWSAVLPHQHRRAMDLMVFGRVTLLFRSHAFAYSQLCVLNEMHSTLYPLNRTHTHTHIQRQMHTTKWCVPLFAIAKLCLFYDNEKQFIHSFSSK